jgi:hypothetical protein
VSPRAGLDEVVKRKNPFPAPAGVRTHLFRPVRSRITIVTELSDDTKKPEKKEYKTCDWPRQLHNAIESNVQCLRLNFTI